MSSQEALGRAIRAAREAEDGLTQEALGKIAGGAGGPAVSAWENGRQPPEDARLSKLIDYFMEHGRLDEAGARQWRQWADEARRAAAIRRLRLKYRLDEGVQGGGTLESHFPGPAERTGDAPQPRVPLLPLPARAPDGERAGDLPDGRRGDRDGDDRLAAVEAVQARQGQLLAQIAERLGLPSEQARPGPGRTDVSPTHGVASRFRRARAHRLNRRDRSRVRAGVTPRPGARPPQGRSLHAV